MKLNIVPARTGFLWVKLGIRTFFRQPLALAGLFFMFTMAVLLLASVPIVGPVAAVILMPGATLGMMVATKEASAGRFPMPSTLLAAFRTGRHRVRAMLMLGGAYALVLLLIVTVTSLLFTAPEGATPAAGSEQDPLGLRPGPGMFVAMALQLPVTVLFAHAPALVHWHGVTPMKSLFFSMIAFLRNFGAFAMFALGWLVVLIGVGALLSVVFALLGTTPTPQAMVPVALLVMAMMSTSMFFTFRDSFMGDAPEEEVFHA